MSENTENDESNIVRRTIKKLTTNNLANNNNATYLNKNQNNNLTIKITNSETLSDCVNNQGNKNN